MCVCVCVCVCVLVCHGVCVCVCVCVRIFSVTVDAALFKLGELEKRRSISEPVSSGAVRLGVRQSASRSDRVI